MLKTFAIALLLAASAGASAGITINTEKYFAYAVLPARGTSVMTVIVLSEEACEANGAPKGSKKAAYQDRYMERPGCWDRYEGIIGICPSTAEVGGKLGNGCFSLPVNRFYDVKSLPTRASF
jgi:hypothetical protein